MFRPLYHETEKTRSHVRYTSLKNIDECTFEFETYQDGSGKVTLVFTNFKNLKKVKPTKSYMKHVLRAAI